ncbi:MAG: hypothetical protein KBT36_12940 [Kurthia sp.]|nr:hypothetical protein [Candidatus Kurthia equi]
MPRVQINLDDNLHDILAQRATTHNLNINYEIVAILENLFIEKPFDYISALKTIIDETAAIEVGQTFALHDLPFFNTIEHWKPNNEQMALKPSGIRAKLGRMFNDAVENKCVPHVIRALNDKGELKFKGSTSLYLKIAQE